MNQTQATTLTPPKKKFRFPVRSSFIWTMSIVASFLLIFFAWYGGIANAIDMSSWPEGLRVILNSSYWHPVASWILAVVITVVMVALFYVLIMLIYLVVKRKFATAKFRCEAITIFAVLLLSWVFKFVILGFDDLGHFQPTLDGALRAIFGALYAAIGGFSFEGLPSDGQGIGNFVLTCFYYGSSVIAGLVFLSVIGSYAAYEFYSFLLLRILRVKDKDLYIFTALNPETLNLASSIVHDEDKEKADNALIVFSGSSLKPFDRHDADCVEVMAHRYIYWSVSGKDQKTILAKLWPNRALGKQISFHTVTVFAFDSDDDHIPNEEENMDYVLLDIKTRLAEMAQKTKKHTAGGETYMARREKILALRKETTELTDILAQGGDMKFIQAKLATLREQLEAEEKRQDDFIRGIREARLALLKKGGVESFHDDDDDDATYDERLKLIRKENMRRGMDLMHVSYYILTKRRIDYQAYQDKIRSLEETFRELYRIVDDECLTLFHEMEQADARLKADPSNPAYQKEAGLARRRYNLSWQSFQPFSIHVWNEADCIASEAQSKVYSGNFPPSFRLLPPDPKLTWVVSLGFGTNGQSIAKALYAYSSALDEDGKAAEFLCDVFDPKATQSIAGLFEMEVPYAACISNRIEGSTAEQYDARVRERIRAVQADAANLPDGFDLTKEMPCPVFNFHDGGFGMAGFTDFFRQGPVLFKSKRPANDVSAPEKERFYCPDYIVVATGDDYESIRVVNALAGLFAQQKPKRLVTLFVNVWDDKNNNLVEGYNRGYLLEQQARHPDFFFAPNVRIVIIGNNDDVYRCHNIVENYDAINYNRIYETVSSDAAEEEASLFNKEAAAYYAHPSDDLRVSIPAKASNIARSKADLWDTIREKERTQAKASWRGNALWRRVSSAASYRFAPAFYQMLKHWDSKENFGVFFAKLARVEHQRWMRFHFADGWFFSANRNDGLRRHPCLLPISLISPHTLIYDLYNVFLGISLCMDKADREAGFKAAVDWTKIHNITERVTSDVAATFPLLHDREQEIVNMVSFGFGKAGEAMAEAVFVNTYDKVLRGKKLRPNKFNCESVGGEDYGPYRVRHNFAIVTSVDLEPESTKKAADRYGDILATLSSRLGENKGKAVTSETSFMATKFTAADPMLLSTVKEFVRQFIPHKEGNKLVVEKRVDYISISLPRDEDSYVLLRRLLYLFRAYFVGDVKLLFPVRVYASFRSPEWLAKAQEILGEGLIEGLSVELVSGASGVDGAEARGREYFTFLKHAFPVSPELDGFASKSVVGYAHSVGKPFAEATNQQALALLERAKAEFNDVSGFTDDNADWEALAEEDKRFYITAALFAQSLKAEAEVLRQEGVKEAELLCRLAIAAHQRDVRYLLCDSWVYREETDHRATISHRYSNILVPFEALDPKDCRAPLLSALYALIV